MPSYQLCALEAGTGAHIVRAMLSGPSHEQPFRNQIREGLRQHAGTELGAANYVSAL